MFVGDRVRVEKLERRSEEDRSPLVGTEGELIQKLNVPWEPALGSLWKVRFGSGHEAVFAEAEIVELDAAGRPLGSEIDELKESWGKAPRTATVRFRRVSGAARAVLAFLLLCVAGVLLIVAGLAQSDLRISAAGGVLVLLGVGSAAVLVR